MSCCYFFNGVMAIATMVITIPQCLTILTSMAKSWHSPLNELNTTLHKWRIIESKWNLSICPYWSKSSLRAKGPNNPSFTSFVHVRWPNWRIFRQYRGNLWWTCLFLTFFVGISVANIQSVTKRHGTNFRTHSSHLEDEIMLYEHGSGNALFPC